MDTSTRSVFREKSLERLTTPKQFNDALKVTKVNVWVALAAILVLVGALLTWGIFGFVEVTIQAHGIADKGVVTCYVPGDSVVAVGMDARIDDIRDAQNIIPGQNGVVTAVTLLPSSMDEFLNDPTIQAGGLSAADHSIVVTISAPGAEDGVVGVTILRERIRPISFLTGPMR